MFYDKRFDRSKIRKAHCVTTNKNRGPGYRGKPVIYFVRIVRTYEDGTTERVLDEKYFGTERRKAFARFAELKHQRPGIEIMKDTEKRSWER